MSIETTDPRFIAAMDSLSSISPITQTEFIHNGINSTVLLSKHDNHSKKVTKFYPEDRTRDRQDAEFQAIHLLKQVGETQIPSVEMRNSNQKFTIFSYVAGQPNPRIKESDLRQLIDFQRNLKKIGIESSYRPIMMASEACPNLSDVKYQVESRLKSLLSSCDNGTRLERYLSTIIRPEIDKKFALAEKKCRDAGIDFHTSIKVEHLTPIISDFGSHNIIKLSTGKFVFVDFEYFGLDSPVTEICNFLLHPSMKLPQTVSRGFRDQMISVHRNIPKLTTLVDIGLPIYGLRWALIVLKSALTYYHNRGCERNLSQQISKAEKLINI